MPSTPTDQEADTHFDKHLSLREQHTDQATLTHGLETNVESCAFQDDFQLQDDRVERMNESFRKETHYPNEQSRLSTNSNSNINQVEPSFDTIVGAISSIETTGQILAKNASPTCCSSESDKAISTNCSGLNPIHIGSVHKSEEEVDNVVSNKHIEREENQTEEKSVETYGLLEKGTNTNKFSKQLNRRISTNCTKLVVVVVIIAIMCLALVIAVIVLFIRTKTLQGHIKENTSGERSNDFNSLTLHVNWSNIKTVNSTQNVNITWFPAEQNKFMNVEKGHH
ncbi:unnamed protein product [Mytilus edulis]|uniref:Uncharacterized protein n=1 Tax=Mytilus edulis TaxID=6550 RepID=A0A8S3Q5L5_MYTED|nr:unnamed protein product [Mytilus edulis]